MATAKDKYLLQKGLVNLNHGSFGTVPHVVMKRHYDYLLEQESCPEIWFRESYFAHINASRQSIAGLIKADLQDVVLVESASYAVNSILRSFPFQVQCITKCSLYDGIHNSTLLFRLEIKSLFSAVPIKWLWTR